MKAWRATPMHVLTTQLIDDLAMSALSSPDGSAEKMAWAVNMAWALAICFSIVSMLSAGWLMGRKAAQSVHENEMASSQDQQKCLAARTSHGSACASLTMDDLFTLLWRAAGVTVSMIPVISSAATFAICFTMVGSLLVAGWLRGASAAQNSHKRETAWRREGSVYIGREVVCAVTYTDGRVGEAWGIITGWLSADQSDFTNDQVSLFLSLYPSSLSRPLSVSPVSSLSLTLQTIRAKQLRCGMSSSMTTARRTWRSMRWKRRC